MTIYEMQARVEQQPATPQAPQRPPSAAELREIINNAMQAARDAAGQQGQGSLMPPTPPPVPNNDVPKGVMVLIIVLGALAAATIIFGPLFRALGRRLDRRGDTGVPPDVVAPRLDRIEQAIEAMAVEVERISEGQRYVTKQMHEMRALPAPNPFAEPALAQRAPEPVRRGDSGT